VIRPLLCCGCNPMPTMKAVRLFAEAAAAHAMLEAANDLFGRIVLHPWDS
jgi:hypothetical protein